MAVTDEYLQYVLEQLAGLGPVTPRRMFGGIGLFHADRIFGLIARDTLYFKVDDSNRRDYEERNMGRLQPFADKPDLSMTYYEVPADTLEDADTCVEWARKSTYLNATPSSSRRKSPRPR